MSEQEKFQQQILFEESALVVEEDSQLNTDQLFVDNQQWLPAEIEQDTALANEEEFSSKPNWLLRVMLVTLSALVGIELVDFFTLGFIESPILTSLYAVVLTCVALLCSSVVIKEVKGLSQLKKREQLKERIVNAAEQDAHQVDILCDEFSEQLSCDIDAQALEKWQQAKQNQLSDQELLSLYSKVVIHQVDQKAMAEVAKSASESVVLVALSPIALLDMFIMVWRNIKMIDKVAGLYGLKLGYWSRISLLKQVFANMIYAGASEVIADVSADMLGADLMGKLSGRLAQGLGAGMLTARLGLKTIYACRPLPFDENAPKLSHVRREVIKQIKQLAQSKS